MAYFFTDVSFNHAFSAEPVLWSRFEVMCINLCKNVFQVP